MASPFCRTIQGHFVIVGKEPDGDSVRFVADNPALYRALRNQHRIKPNQTDGSVQLRFEAVDAPELHYGPDAQPLGAESRDALLGWMGFTNVQFDQTNGTLVTASDPDRIRGAILSKAAEANGRPVAYVLVGDITEGLQDGAWLHVDETLLRETLNYRLLETGMAYYTVYTSTASAHREVLRSVAGEAG